MIKGVISQRVDGSAKDDTTPNQKPTDGRLRYTVCSREFRHGRTAQILLDHFRTLQLSEFPAASGWHPSTTEYSTHRLAGDSIGFGQLG
ncbi:hypothetical protein [Micromonospora sp. ATA51]|uniref:hypothetical protein n=1 Tax=Micromonospora sp. ATA51 TaxID=2806098 RepID=UPI001A51AB90|nr:hypothetical protein [Micromonospora sp. ATA51]MBM0227529.1 hypothetical protein [Micromonospora sp. ATA51]